MIRNESASKRKLLLFLFVISSSIKIIILFNRSSSTKNEVNNIDPLKTSTTSTCKHVSVNELDQWFHSKQWNEIPKIIHQTWKNKSLRGQQTRWSQTWCEQYTDWRYHLWTDDENYLFVKTKFPWFYSTFEQLSPAILRVDSVRYLYLFYYGGLYIDLDYESILRVDQLFINKTVVLSLINYSIGSLNSIPNSWMASQPNHPLWAYLSHRIMILWSRATEQQRKTYWNGKAELFTGPQLLYGGLMFYLHSKQHNKQSLDQLFNKTKEKTANVTFEVADVTFLGPKLINAYDWMSGIGGNVCSAEQPTFDENKCKEIVKPIYAITYWSHSYGHGHENDPNYLENKKA